METTFDAALVRKYNRPGPRYTSYPTAVQFHDVDDPETLLPTAQPDAPLSLYLHLPFCESLCWFCGCTTVITRDPRKAETYLDYLEKEIALVRPRLGADRPVAQLHFGGGTPNFFSPAQLDRLSDILHGNFTFAPDAECSVELDPRRLTRAHVQAFARMGIRRASFGVQDVQEVVQKAIHRVQPHALNVAAVEWLREAGFESVNLDLIYGLPHQTPESFAATIDTVLELEPDRLAVFSYAHVPWIKPAQKILERDGALPTAETKLTLLQLFLARLQNAGFYHIGMDHFARPDDELAVAQRQGTLQRNFQGYSTRAGLEIVGLGMSSIGQTDGLYRQNHKTLPEYYGALDAGRLPLTRGYFLTDEDQRRRTIIMRLMCDFALDFDRLDAALGLDFAVTYAEELTRFDPMEADGLVLRAPRSLHVTPVGKLLIRNLAMVFDAYLKPAAEANSPRFSRTI